MYTDRMLNKNSSGASIGVVYVICLAATGGRIRYFLQLGFCRRRPNWCKHSYNFLNCLEVTRRDESESGFLAGVPWSKLDSDSSLLQFRELDDILGRIGMPV
jgi:hypothetical protein